MKKGDFVITEHPESRSSRLARSYGIIQDITKTDSAIIKMADGSVIERQFNAIAVYIQPPLNWRKLYLQQVLFSQRNRGKMFPKSKKKSLEFTAVPESN